MHTLSHARPSGLDKELQNLLAESDPAPLLQSYLDGTDSSLFKRIRNLYWNSDSLSRRYALDFTAEESRIVEYVRTQMSEAITVLGRIPSDEDAIISMPPDSDLHKARIYQVTVTPAERRLRQTARAIGLLQDVHRELISLLTPDV